MNLKIPIHQLPPHVRSQGQNDKHRSALLDMFKQADPNISPKDAALAAAVGDSASGSKRASVAGASPHGLLAHLSVQDHSGVHPTEPYRSAEHHGESGSPGAQGASTSSSQPLMRLLRRQEEAPEPQPQRKPPVSPYAAYDHTHAAPTAYGSPPAPASFPAPMFHRGQGVPPEHKQKLLSLFSQQQYQHQELAATEGKDKGKGVGAGIELHGTSTSGPGSAEGNGRDSRGPISPADRSFLLGYLQSATHGQ